MHWNTCTADLTQSFSELLKRSSIIGVWVLLGDTTRPANFVSQLEKLSA